jgi:cob(I)alamin adenosyltransferase
MADKPASRDETLVALDFIANVLRQHEKDLDRLINELSIVIQQLGDSGKLSDKMEKIEEEIINLQREITNLTRTISNAPKEVIPTESKELSSEGT